MTKEKDSIEKVRRETLDTIKNLARNYGTRTSSSSHTAQAQEHVNITEAMDHPILESVGEIYDVSKTPTPLNDTKETTSKQTEDQHKDDTNNEPKEHHESTRKKW